MRRYHSWMDFGSSYSTTISKSAAPTLTDLQRYATYRDFERITQKYQGVCGRCITAVDLRVQIYETEREWKLQLVPVEHDFVFERCDGEGKTIDDLKKK